MQKEIEKHFTRQELRRVPFGEVGSIAYPARAARATRATCSTTSTSRRSATRGFRIVVDYGYSAGSFVLPLVLGPLGVEAVTAHAFESDPGRRRPLSRDASTRRSGSSRRSTPTSAPSSTAPPSGSS